MNIVFKLVVLFFLVTPTYFSCFLVAAETYESNLYDEAVSSRVAIRPPRIRMPKLSPAKIPKVAPTVRSISTTTKVWKNSVAKNMKALKVTSGTARTQLRSALAHNRKVKMPGFEAHHVILWKFRKMPVLKKAARGGWNINSAGNGIRVPLKTHKSFHGVSVNSSNNLEIRNFLERLNNTKFTDRQIASILARQRGSGNMN